MDVEVDLIVVNCPTCKRTIWANSLCRHGVIPPPPAPIHGVDVTIDGVQDAEREPPRNVRRPPGRR